jgi:hypothetical protein
VRSSIYLVLCLAACASAPAPTPAPAPVATPVVAPPAPPEEAIAEPNRALTAGEIALLRPIFRDGIDYDHVRVIDNAFPLQPANVYMTPRGHIYAPGRLFQPDFSAVRGSLRQIFVHEMTHVWQYANGMDLVSQGFLEMLKNNGAYEKAYAYELVPGRDLTDYGMEQQASIIEDYFAITVDHDRPRELTNASLPAAERDQLYAAVIKNFVGNARYARTLDPRAVAERHAQASEPTHGAPRAGGYLCDWRYTPPRPPTR